MGWRCREDSRLRHATAEARPARCRADSEAAGGRAVSADLDAFESGKGSTAAIDSSRQAGAHARAGEERTAAPGDEPGHHEEAEIVERRGREGALRVAAEAVGQPAARRPVEVKKRVGRTDC